MVWALSMNDEIVKKAGEIRVERDRVNLETNKGAEMKRLSGKIRDNIR